MWERVKRHTQVDVCKPSNMYLTHAVEYGSAPNYLDTIVDRVYTVSKIVAGTYVDLEVQFHEW